MAFISFNFTFDIKDGMEFTWNGAKGIVNDQELVLGETGMSLAAVAETLARPERLIIALRDGAQVPQELHKRINEGVLVLNILTNDSLKIKRHIDRFASAIAARMHKEQLDAAGQTAAFRSTLCPYCQATINLTGFAETAYFYCPYCESLYLTGGALISKGDDYCVCDECEMFGRVQEYKIFYFYFLLVVYGWRSQQRCLCDGCARSALLKALLINLIFILGVPVALWGLMRSYMGQDPRFEQLLEANDYARDGSPDLAGNLYQAMSGKNPMNPAFAMNKALGHLHLNDANGAVQSLSTALTSCSNYIPAIRILQRIAPPEQRAQ